MELDNLDASRSDNIQWTFIPGHVNLAHTSTMYIIQTILNSEQLLPPKPTSSPSIHKVHTKGSGHSHLRSLWANFNAAGSHNIR